MRQLQQQDKQHSSIMYGGIIMVLLMGTKGTMLLVLLVRCHFGLWVFDLVVLAARMPVRSRQQLPVARVELRVLPRQCHLRSLVRLLGFLNHQQAPCDVWNFLCQSTAMIQSLIN